MSGIFHFHQIYTSGIIHEFFENLLDLHFLLIPHLQKIQQFIMFKTNYCHLFAANVCARSARIKQVESLRIVSLDFKPPG